MNKERSKVIVLLKMITMVKPLAGFMLLAIIAGSLAYLAVQFIPVLGAMAILIAAGFDMGISLKTVWILLPVFALVRAVLRYIEQRTGHYIAFTLLAIVRDKVFKALRRLCPARLEGRDKGDLISLITSDVELLEVFYAHTISPICIAIVVETVMCLYIGSFSPALGIIAAIAFVIVGVLVPIIISRVSGTMGDELRKLAGELSAFVLESIRGLDEIIQYGHGINRKYQMNQKTDELTVRQGELNKLTGLNLAIANSFILVSDIVMICVAFYLYINGAIGFDGMLLSIFAFMSSFGPVSALAGLGTTLQGTIASGARILDILEEEPETYDVTGFEETTFEGAGCDKVTFSYGGSTVLSDFSVDFPKDMVVGVVGKSGSGKSTMLKLLMRFWAVSDGRINISGKNIDEVNTDNLRDMESYMTQDTVLFKDTIAANIRVGKLSATDEEVVEAAKKASIHDFIMTLPKGYETSVGELGETLSGGERQRIGLARAFLHNAPFLLLDEPTSNLDSLNEAVILKSIKEESADKTVALVSHRRSTMRIADTIIEVG